ncbi:MAG: hypothetical protein O3B01_28865 [Planctomycetota bacterium]|nr:hypothetical protein [Planctomycetota bacterium]MDA1142595.1 hypothetical protein [Planctomycetota bacterium]
MERQRALGVSAITAFCLLVFGCGSDPAPPKDQSKTNKGDGHSEHATDHEAESKKAHDHEAPHGGTLVVFGEEFAHMEMVVDETSGKLTIYFLDGLASNGVRLKTESLTLLLSTGEKRETITLKGVENDLTGETVNESSQFEGQSDFLKANHKFEVHISVLNIKGVEFKEVKFDFPEGNEAHDEDEHHKESEATGKHQGTEER